MPEMTLHQGAGLQRNLPPTGLRLLAVLSQNNARATHVLWQVCAQLQGLGYPLVVLDGTSAESESTPGLAHLLSQSHWNDGARPALAPSEADSLAVLPALHGLATLARDALTPLHPSQHPLQPLQTLFGSYALVVLHAPAAALASPLLKGLSTTPLLVLQPDADGVLAGYRQLKQLALNTGLSAAVACVVPQRDTEHQHQARDVLDAVRDCAARHLGQRIGTMLLQADNAADVQRLALQLLESAGPLPSATPSADALPWAAAEPFTRSSYAPAQAQTPSHFQPGH